MSDIQEVVTPAEPAKPPYWKPVFLTAAMVTVIVSVILTIFAWPVATATPKDVPIGITSIDPTFSTQIKAEFAKNQPGTFKFVDYASLEEAKAGITHREVYGAIVIANNPQVLIATGASPAMAQLLNNMAVQLGYLYTEQFGLQAVRFNIEDLAPLSDKDPRGLGLSAGSLPLIIAGIVVGIFGSMRLRRRSQMFATAGIAGVLAGSSMVAILNLWLGSLSGNYFLEVLVVALTIAAVSLTVMGAAKLAGRIGMLLVIGLFFIVGNPLAGVALPPELYPYGLGTFGQYLPLGAEVSLLRRISFFPEAGTLTLWVTLLTWFALGALLVVLSSLKKPKQA